MRHARPWYALVACAVLLVGCSSTADRPVTDALKALDVSAIPTPTTTTTAPPSPAVPCCCTDPTASLRPLGPLPTPGDMPAGTFMRRIQDRGYLIVGVDQNTKNLGYFNPVTQQIEGFEIDVARYVAQAIFGDPTKVELTAVLTNDRIPDVEQGTVDMVADAVTMTCARWQSVAFSTVYLEATQQTLVRADSKVQGLSGLSGKSVCATSGSTALTVVS